MKQKKIRLSRKNLQEFVDKYKDIYIYLPEGTEITKWKWNSKSFSNERKKYLSEYIISGKVDKITKDNNLQIDDDSRDGVIVHLDKPIEISMDDFETKPKMHYSTFDEAFEDLVPDVGNAFCKAGEIIRAYSNLCYSFYNNGDKVGCDCGGNTRQYQAGEILAQLVENRAFQEKLDKLYGTYRDDYYERSLEAMESMLLDYINDNEELYDPDDFEPIDFSNAQWY